MQNFCNKAIQSLSKSLDFSELSLPADRWGTGCYCHIDSFTGNTQKFNLSAGKGLYTCSKFLRGGREGFLQWLEPGQVLLPGRSPHIIDLAFVLTPLAHNVQYIKLRQQTNSSWGQSPLEARPAAPAVWMRLWSPSGFPPSRPVGLLYPKHRRILLQCQHNEIWARSKCVHKKNAKNVCSCFFFCFF